MATEAAKAVSSNMGAVINELDEVIQGVRNVCKVLETMPGEEARAQEARSLAGALLKQWRKLHALDTAFQQAYFPGAP